MLDANEFAKKKPFTCFIRLITAEKKHSHTLVKPMSYVVEIAVFTEYTGSQPEANQIIYEEVDGVSKPCVPWSCMECGDCLPVMSFTCIYSLGSYRLYEIINHLNDICDMNIHKLALQLARSDVLGDDGVICSMMDVKGCIN